jgi:hypothetical protein
MSFHLAGRGPLRLVTCSDLHRHHSGLPATVRPPLAVHVQGAWHANVPGLPVAPGGRVRLVHACMQSTQACT